MPNSNLKRFARAVLLLVSATMFPALGQAQFTYTTNADSTLTITRYTGLAGAVTIPTNINGATVTGIAANAFAANTNIANVTIPSTVLNIGDSAFSSCSNLSNISIAPGVGSIGKSVFYLCQLTNVTLPVTVTNLGQYAFEDCSNLTNVVILGNCNIGMTAFARDNPPFPSIIVPPNLLQSVYIAGGSVGVGAFWGCSNLTSATFGPFVNVASPGVTNIGENAFYGCTALSNVIFPTNLVTIQQTAFQNCTALTSVVIPVNTLVGSNAFQNCTNLGNITLTSGITSIGGGAFAYTGVTNLIVPATVTNIGPSAFSSCLKLTNVSILGTCNINSFAFSFIQGLNSWLGSPDYALQSVYISGGVISDYAFYNCTNLYTLILGNQVSDIRQFAFDGVAVQSLTIPGSCSHIGGWAFLQGVLTNLTLNEGLQTVDGFAFSRNLIGGLSLPASLQTIGPEGFSVNPITNLTIGNGLISMGSQCFEASRISHVTVPSGLVDVGTYYSFGLNSNLTAAIFLGNAPTAGPTTFTNCSTNLVIYYLPGTTGWSNTFTGIPTAVWNPTLQKHDGNFGLRNGQFGFNLTGPAYIPVAIQSSTNPKSGWTNVTTVTLTNGSFYFSDPQPVSGSARFYRLSPPP